MTEEQQIRSKCGICGELTEYNTVVKKVELSDQNLPEVIENICSCIRHSANTLKDIQIYDCKLTENLCENLALALANCSKIEIINLNSNDEMGIGLSTIFNQLAASSKCLKDIDISDCMLNKGQSSEFGSSLQKFSKLERINLSGNECMENGLSKICIGLANSSDSLKAIEVGMCGLTEHQASSLGNLLENCCKIEIINLNGNGLTNNGLSYICSGLEKSSSTLRYINFSSCCLHFDQFKTIGILLNKCSKLERIDFSNIEKEKLAIFSDGVKRLLSSFKSLKVDESSLTKEQAQSFKILSDHLPKLVKSNIEANNGLLLIFDGLIKSYGTLKNLQFEKSKLTEEQATRLGNILENINQLEIVNFAWNDSLSNGLNKITNGLQKSLRTLKDINFSHCNLNEKQSIDIANMLKKCPKIETINLSFNEKMKEGFFDVCDGLYQSRNTLKHINLIQCHLPEDALKYLGNMLEVCFKIEKIELAFNKNMGDGLLKICKGLVKSSSTLTVIDFSYCSLKEVELKYIEDMLENITENSSKLKLIKLDGNCHKANKLQDICNKHVKSLNNSKGLNLQLYQATSIQKIQLASTKTE